jgi:hypothetical protein
VSRQQNDLLWLNDMLEHLSECRKQLEWAEDAASIRVLTESMLRDLESCRRICETLQHRATRMASVA